jgi:AcrR family transcriptional regulator
MPQWAETVQAHREEVRDTILAAAGELVRRRGLLAITMSHIAEAAGIGRATLYKYFPDVEHVMAAWHDREVTAHLTQLAAIRDQPGPPAERLRALLSEYGRICQQRRHHGDAELLAALHRRQLADGAQDRLVAIMASVITEAAADGAVRGDVPPSELATYCINALQAAATATTPSGLTRLTDVVWAGLAPAGGTAAPQ